ncbi:MAG: NUDIX domain-containing protein [Actinomycetota bacterium]|nr:NUDIX domain-containing protein [Actinomycetota bacterium]
MSSEPRAVVVDRGRAFVIRRSSTRRLFPNCWDIPGGHVECGESDEEALARKLEEETGWRLEQVRAPLGEHRWLGDDGIARVERDLLVQVEGNLDRPRLEVEKYPEARWISGCELEVLLEARRPGDDLTYRVVARGLETAARLEQERKGDDGHG